MPNRRQRLAILFVLLVIGGVIVAITTDLRARVAIRSALTGDGVFEVKPYLQRGDGRDTLDLLWQTADRDASWKVEVRTGADRPWVEAPPATSRRVALNGVWPFRLYRAVLGGLTPGGGFTYRVLRAGKLVFEATGIAPKPPGGSQRVVVFGDCAAGTSGQSAVAYQTYQAKPDYVVVTGDVVYYRGRVLEYLDHFFPVYNAETAGPSWGAPLLRSTLFFTAPGNHDLIERNLDRYPDGLAYFYYWDFPLNGPDTVAGAPGTPTLKGSADRQEAYLHAAGSAYPRMANYSFDYGDVHWTVLDGNTYTDWTDPARLAWLDADLAAAKDAAWRIVAFHQPAFHSSKTHGEDQRMRLLAPNLEKGKVAIAFNGHVHNYQRSRPLRFVVGPTRPNGAGPGYGPAGEVDGKWTLDTTYDGANQTRPDGVIYIVTGAGGARLYDTGQTDAPASWNEYTARFVSNVHSLTIADVTPGSITVRQVSAEGVELDRFVVTREIAPTLSK